MSRGGYAQYEIDRRTPSLEMLLKLSKLYKVGIDTFINPDTIPLTEEKQIDKIKVVSLAKLFAEAIKRINEATSIGEIFE